MSPTPPMSQTPPIPPTHLPGLVSKKCSDQQLNRPTPRQRPRQCLDPIVVDPFTQGIVDPFTQGSSSAKTGSIPSIHNWCATACGIAWTSLTKGKGVTHPSPPTQFSRTWHLSITSTMMTSTAFTTCTTSTTSTTSTMSSPPDPTHFPGSRL